VFVHARHRDDPAPTPVGDHPLGGALDAYEGTDVHARRGEGYRRGPADPGSDAVTMARLGWKVMPVFFPDGPRVTPMCARGAGKT
jgi:hypothetical protein